MNVNKFLFLTACVGALAVSGCNKQEEQPAAPGKTTAEQPADTTTSAIVAVVNATPITEDRLDAYVKHRTRKPIEEINEEQRQALLQELINQELIVQDAIKRGIDQQPDVAAEMENQRRVALATAALRMELEKHPISDEVLKAEYEKQVAANASKEYKARHILVPTEEEAKAIIAELDGGADFAELAKEKSTGPSGKDGGDLGWFAPGQMVEPFSNAVATMEKGTYTKAPVQTEFGWHVILLEDTRELEPPSFEEVKERVRNYLKNQQLQDYVQGLSAQAQIEVK